MSDAQQPTPCEQCREKPIVSFDEGRRVWDCVHWCYDRLSGAINQPTRDAAVEAWNRICEPCQIPKNLPADC